MQEVLIKPKVRQADTETSQLIQYLLKRKFVYLGILTVVFISTFFLFKSKVLLYSSYCTFYVNDVSILSGGSLDLRSVENITNEANYSRLVQLCNSSAVHKRLIQKFDLVRHYDIDSTKEFYYQKAVGTIRNRIEVRKAPGNTITVSVKDRYRYKAAEMANEIVSYIDQLNQNYYKVSLEKKLKIAGAFVEQLKKENELKSRNIDHLMQRLNEMSERTSNHLLTFQVQKLSELLSTLEVSTNDLVNSQRLYMLAFQTLNNQNLPTLLVTQNAMPSYRSIAIDSFLLSTLVCVLLCCAFVLHAYLFVRYHHFYTMIFLKNGTAESHK